MQLRQTSMAVTSHVLMQYIAVIPSLPEEKGMEGAA